MVETWYGRVFPKVGSEAIPALAVDVLEAVMESREVVAREEDGVKHRNRTRLSLTCHLGDASEGLVVLSLRRG